jgi:NAD+-dependent farnesol dehydrogenase
MKVFLTGGTGYLGRALRTGLLEAGHQVTVLSRNVHEAGGDARLRWLVGDLQDGPPPPEALHQHRVVLHAAALVKSWVRDRSLFDRVNVEAWDALCERCYQVGVPKILHTSSFLSLGPSPDGRSLTEEGRAVRERFLTDYERTKYLADAVTDRWLAKGLPVSTLYPTILFGPGACTDGNLVGKMIWWIARGRFPGLIGGGDRIWNLAYLPDVVSGHISALEHALPGQRYILGGHNVSLEELVTRIYGLLGRPPHYRRLKVGTAEFLGRSFEWAARITGRAPDLTRGVAGVYRHHWAYDSAKAERALGYALTPLEKALGQTVSWAAGLRKWAD